MRFLKKASYQDITGEKKEHPFHYYEPLSAKYKEFELFLSECDMDELLNKQGTSFRELIKALKKNGAAVSAIHCPRSRFKTCNEGENELSGNYLSLCEVIRDDNSKDIFKNVLLLADKICVEQAEKEELYNGVYEDDASIPQYINESITVVLHEGCYVGCINGGDGYARDDSCNADTKTIADTIKALIESLEIKSSIRVALENVTPFYSTVDPTMSKGGNCGWKADNQKSKIAFFSELNKELENTKLRFGACVDLCHIMVSSRIMGEEKTKSGALEDYFAGLDYAKNIFLFHVSNYGDDLSHGQMFQLDDPEDKKALEKIRFLCNQYAPKAPITFEMADGTDVEKAAINYEHIMFYFSNKHWYGRFNELLIVEENKELKEFFDNLFVIYSYDKKAVFEITNALWRVKQIILKNTYNQEKEKRLFGVDFDKTEVDLSLIRLKAYVYYTRFCNLGNYLADNYYSEGKYIWEDSVAAAIDFGLAMKYFIFNDQIQQCVYTGIKYKFLIDFLPKKESFVRFNDGIGSTRALKVKSDNVFDDVIKKIPDHINGSSIADWNGEADFFSVGKNFVQCLFKYYSPKHSDWSVRIYKDMPINYVDYREKRYSIQAFTQMALSDENFIKKDDVIALSLDISRFASGREGNGTDTLAGFLRRFTDKGITVEKVASISDEEILFSNLEGCSMSYFLDREEGIILKKVCLSLLERKTSTEPIEIKFVKKIEKNFIDTDRLELKVNEVNENRNHQIWHIIEAVKDNISESKMKSEELKALTMYEGSFCDSYIQYDEFLSVKRGEQA